MSFAALIENPNPLEYTIAGAIVLCAISIATMVVRSSIKREERKSLAYEKDLELRRLADAEEQKLRREQDKEFQTTIETMTRENHKAALNQMRERTQLDSKNLEALGVIGQATTMSSQSISLLLKQAEETHRKTDEILEIVKEFQCKGDDAA